MRPDETRELCSPLLNHRKTQSPWLGTTSDGWWRLPRRQVLLQWLAAPHSAVMLITHNCENLLIVASVACFVRLQCPFLQSGKHSTAPVLCTCGQQTPRVMLLIRKSLTRSGIGALMCDPRSGLFLSPYQVPVTTWQRMPEIR